MKLNTKTTLMPSNIILFLLVYLSTQWIFANKKKRRNMPILITNFPKWKANKIMEYLNVIEKFSSMFVNSSQRKKMNFELYKSVNF